MTSAAVPASGWVEESVEPLADHERSAVHALAEQLAAFPPHLLDDPGWLTQARRLSCRLPERLRGSVRSFRHDAGPDGRLLLANLPVDENSLPDTPNEPESVDRIASVPAAICILVGLLLGEIVAYRDEKRGALVQNVIPVRALAQSQSNSGSVPLEFHTENAFHPHRPDFIAMLCLRNDHKGSGGTRLSSIRRALPMIDPADRALLQAERFVTEAPPSFRSGGRTNPHPVLLGCPDDPDIRVDFNATIPLDEEGRRSLDRLRTILSETAVTLRLSPGEMVLFDNRLVVHGRTGFSPRYDGRDRWLYRIYLNMDHRRSRPFRDAGRPVIA